MNGISARDVYYNKGELLSFHAFLNMVVGNRGGGKTYGFKTWSIDDFLKTGHQFLWVRRYATEIETMIKKFFFDITEKYPNCKLDVKGNKKFGELRIDDKVAGYYVALSTSAILKSSSFPKVDKIIFDEFLIIGNTYHYLHDEVVLLLELIETVFRNRENDPDAVQPRGVYLLGNNVTIANPYFLYFGIKNFKGRFYHDKERSIVVEKYCNTKFVELKKASKIGKLTAGTTYAEYSIENQSYLDNNDFIAKRAPNSKFNCAIDYKGKTYGFWLDYKNGYMYVSYEFDPSSYNHYALTRDDHTVNTFLIKSLDNTYIKNVVWQFRNSNMFFEDNQIKAQVYEILSYFTR